MYEINKPFGRVLLILIPIADAILFIIGILLIFTIGPLKTIPAIQVPMRKHPLGNAYLYGLLYGPIVLPCSGPVIVAVALYDFIVNLQNLIVS